MSDSENSSDICIINNIEDIEKDPEYYFLYLRMTFSDIFSCDFILSEYERKSSNRNLFDRRDLILINLLIKYGYVGSLFRVVKIKKKYFSFIKISDHFSHEEIEINYELFKLNEIMKICSSEEEDCNILKIKIEQILSMKIEEFAISDIQDFY